MTSIINNLLTRRGRKNTYKSQLDSTWGDLRITSPTDTAHIWHPHNPRVSLPLSKQPTPDLYHGATPTEFSEPTPTDFGMPGLTPKFNFAAVTSDSASAFSFLPTPNYTPLQSPSQTSCHPQQGLALFDPNAKAESDASIKPKVGLMGRRGNGNALAIYGINSPVSGSISPLYTPHEMSGHSQLASPTSPIQPGDHVVCVPSRRPLSPAEITALARRPSTSSQTGLEQTRSPVQQYYTSLNGAAIESLQSPLVTILSPVSEAFPSNSELGYDDGIIVFDVNAEDADDDDDDETSLSQRRRSASVSRSDYLQDSNLTPVDPASITRFLQQPLNHQYDDQGDHFSEVSSQISSRSQSRTGSIITDDDSVSIHSSPRHSNAFLPEAWPLNDVDIETASTSSHLPSDMSTSLAQAQRIESGVAGSSSVQSPTAEVSRAMRLMSPPLSTTARMRKQSLPMSPNSCRPPSGEPETSARGQDMRVSDTARMVSSVQRQRSASLEPPPSPSFFNRKTSFTQRVTNVNPSHHRRQQSDNSAQHVYIPIREYGHYVQNSIPQHLQQSTGNPPAHVPYAGSQNTFTSPDLPAWSNPPVQQTNAAYQFGKESSFYDSIREDCRNISREARAAKNGALVTQFKRASEPARSDKPKVQTRARSISRLRDHFTKQQSRPEDKPVGPQIQLVPSYREMWE